MVFSAWNKIAEVLSSGDSGFCLEEKPSFLREFALLSASEFDICCGMTG